MTLISSTGSSKAHKQIRKEIIDKHKLEAVISMPSGVFRPYASVSTGILIFTKTTTGGTDKVWFYDMQADGLSLDDKRIELVKTGPDGGMKFPDDYGDILDIISRWNNSVVEQSRSRNDKSFYVPVEEIRVNNYDLRINIYKEVIYKEKHYGAPELIIAEIRQLDNKRSKALEALEGLLK